jgi:hypothetical protein
MPHCHGQEEGVKLCRGFVVEDMLFAESNSHSCHREVRLEKPSGFLSFMHLLGWVFQLLAKEWIPKEVL